MPLVEGDTLATGSNARAEIQIDARNFVRLAPDSAVTLVTLREEGIAISVANGTATLRLARFDRIMSTLKLMRRDQPSRRRPRDFIAWMSSAGDGTFCGE